MFAAFFLLWLILNGRITVEIVLFGLAISDVMFFFMCHFMGYSLKREIHFLKKVPVMGYYILVLIKEILKANRDVLFFILSPKYEVEPKIVRFRTDLKTEAARALLANSITLTPGTITLTLEGDEYEVHCLDKSFAEGISDSIFVQLLRKLEEE